MRPNGPIPTSVDFTACPVHCFHQALREKKRWRRMRHRHSAAFSIDWAYLLLVSFLVFGLVSNVGQLPFGGVGYSMDGNAQLPHPSEDVMDEAVQLVCRVAA